jgi:SOS response regulatory protein OraA/RecX
MGRIDPESKKYWLDLALFYCSKRETSRSRLRAYFIRKIREYQIPEEKIPQNLEWIESVLNHCEEKHIIDHERYAGILHRDFLRRGKGKRYIEQKLRERGLDQEIKKLEFEKEEELERARDLAVKTLNRSQIKNLTDPWKMRTKVLQKLISSGFDLDVAKQALDWALKNRDTP